MSSDAALNKGDLMIDVNGDIALVRNTAKAVQDILKIIHTPIGSNPLFPQIGSALTTSNIGQNINQQFAEAKVTTSIAQSIQQLQSLQRNQALVQQVTPEETIVSIAQVTATQDSQDPRQYDITVVVTTEALPALVLPPFTMSTTIG